MQYARWYPSMVTQPDGTQLTFGGVVIDNPQIEILEDRVNRNGDKSQQTINRALANSADIVLPNLVIGMNMLKRAVPDGSTIGVVISLAQTIDLIQNKTASFDIVKDFTPITAIADNPAGSTGPLPGKPGTPRPWAPSMAKSSSR